MDAFLLIYAVCLYVWMVVCLNIKLFGFHFLLLCFSDVSSLSSGIECWLSISLTVIWFPFPLGVLMFLSKCLTHLSLTTPPLHPFFLKFNSLPICVWVFPVVDHLAIYTVYLTVYTFNFSLFFFFRKMFWIVFLVFVLFQGLGFQMLDLAYPPVIPTIVFWIPIFLLYFKHQSLSITSFRLLFMVCVYLLV